MGGLLRIVGRSHKFANLGNDHGFISKEIHFHWTRPFEKSQCKATRAYAQSGSVIPNTDHIKKVNPNPFKPKRVSFGPYHHGELHLLPMEKKKHLACHEIKRCYGLSIEVMVNEVWDMLEDLRPMKLLNKVYSMLRWENNQVCLSLLSSSSPLSNIVFVLKTVRVSPKGVEISP